jgi:hypothetical protein
MNEQQAAGGVRRIAVIVVAGVGEQSASATSLHGNLVKWVDSYVPDDAPPGSVDFAVARVNEGKGEWGSDERTLENVPTVTLRRARPGSDPDQVDVFEMPWSDLSRFPRGLPGFIATLFGLAVQFGTIGLEAIDGLTRRSETATRHFTLQTMRFASWFAAALVIPVTTTMVVAAVNLWLVLDVPAGLPDWVMLFLVGTLGGFAVWFVAKALDDGGWVYEGRPEAHGRLRDRLRSVLTISELRRIVRGPIPWALAIYAVTCAGWVWLYFEERSIRIASAETLLYGAGYGLRAGWLVALAVLAGALLALLVWAALRRVWDSEQDERDGEGFRGRWVSGVLTMIISPFAVALVGTLLFAGVAGVAFKSAEDARWGSEATKIQCFSGASSWQTSGDCGSKPDEWPATAMHIAQLHANAEELSAQADQETDLDQKLDLESQAADARDAANEIEADAGATPVDWAKALFVIITIPVFVAVLALLIVLVLALFPFVRNLRSYWGQRGAVLARTLRLLWRPATSVVLAGIALAVIVATWCVWLGWLGPLSFLSGDPWGSDRAGLLTFVGVAAAGLLLVSRFLPIDVRGFGGHFGKLEFGGAELGGNLESLRKRLDPAYDIASYLRKYRDKTGTRPKIIARYRALLREIARRNYDGLLIVAHSQGAVLSAATLFGDPYRREPEDENEDGRGVLAWGELRDRPDLPENVALITCGCPLRQSYDGRMPGDYSWLWASTTDLSPLTLAWINAYRPRDYIGQAMFRVPLTPESQKQGRVFTQTPAGRVARLDVCLKGKGGHVGYWTDGEFAMWVDYAVALCLGEVDPPCPNCYSPGRPGSDC